MLPSIFAGAVGLRSGPTTALRLPFDPSRLRPADTAAAPAECWAAFDAAAALANVLVLSFCCNLPLASSGVAVYDGRRAPVD